MKVSDTAVTVLVPVVTVTVALLLIRIGSQYNAWHSEQRTALANLVHSASRFGFAAAQDSNVHMSLMNSCTATARLASVRSLLSDPALSRMVGTDIRAMAARLEEQQRKIVGSLAQGRRPKRAH
jgi:hypothetical protein